MKGIIRPGERGLSFPTFLVLFGLFFAVTNYQAFAQYFAGPRPLISEIMSANYSTVADEDGDFSDWIEITNMGNEPVQLAGYGLTDDPDRPFAWVFPAIILDPGKFLLVWASGKDRTDPSLPLHTNFSINQTGEELLLTSPSGGLSSQMPAVTLHADISYGLVAGTASTFGYFQTPTPGSANIYESFYGILSPPSFTVEEGFHPGGANVGITHSDPGVEIRYSIDCSVPDQEAVLYTGPLNLGSLAGTPNDISEIRTNPLEVPSSIEWYPPAGEVEKAHVIRAVAYKPGYISSSTLTGTFLTGESGHTLPVISVVTDRKNLFDHYTGIYIPGITFEQNGYGDGWYGQPNANYFKRGDEWEIPAHIGMFENGVPVMRQDAGIRIHGGGTRALPMKSLRLYARGEYGNTHFEHTVFPEQQNQAYKRLILRNSGQDFYGYGTMFRDGFMHKLVEPLGWDIQDYRPSVVYLNGEYWGIHNIRERYDHHYFERKYGIEEEELDFLESNQRVRNGSAVHYSNMITFVEENGLSDMKMFDSLAGMMDIDNYIDYFVVNVFFNNIDWPGHNLKYWRYSGEPYNNPPAGKDGRWRWAFNDFDFGFGNTEGLYPYNQNTLVHATHPDGSSWPPNPPWSTFLIRSLLGNETFRAAFINRFGDLMNSVLSSRHMTEVITEMAEVVEPEIERHIERWGHPGGSKEAWDDNIQRMLRFADRRPDHQTGHILNYFELSGTFTLNVDVNNPDAGTVMVNRLLIEQGPASGNPEGDLFPWSGTWFRGVPLPLTAVPRPGFQFAGWIDQHGELVSDNPLLIEGEGNISVTALFGEQTTFYPEPWKAAGSEPFLFTRWEADSEAGSFPEAMAFVYMDRQDPGADAPVEGFTSGRYDLDSRTRINGLGCGGVSFINTSNPDGNLGYPGGRLGGVLVSVDTRDVENIQLMFTASTVLRNSRIYNIRLQYRTGDHGEFSDLLPASGDITEYAAAFDGHSRSFGPFPLPDHLHGLPCVQLLWRYYYTGEQEDPESGQRSELRIGSISLYEGDFPFSDIMPYASIRTASETVCDNDTITLIAGSDVGNSTARYSWFSDGELLHTGYDSTFRLANPEDGIRLWVEVDNTGSCLPGLPVVSPAIELEVFQSPPAPDIALSDSLLISSVVSGNQWYGVESGLIGGATGQEFVPEYSDSYYVIVNDGVCYSDPSNTIEYVITSIPGFADTDAAKLLLYPNPAGENLKIEVKGFGTGPLCWNITDISGRIVKSGVAETNEFSIDLGDIPSGIYILSSCNHQGFTPERFIRR